MTQTKIFAFFATVYTEKWGYLRYFVGWQHMMSLFSNARESAPLVSAHGLNFDFIGQSEERSVKVQSDSLLLQTVRHSHTSELIATSQSCKKSVSLTRYKSLAKTKHF